MNKPIQYTDEPLGDLEIVPDFLPPPDALVLKQQPTSVTIALSAESVEFFKAAAKRHNTPYQQLIRRLLDDYVATEKRKASTQ